jgi:hypothetical protein
VLKTTASGASTPEGPSCDDASWEEADCDEPALDEPSFPDGEPTKDVSGDPDAPVSTTMT